MIGSDNGLLLDGTKRFPKPLFTVYQIGSSEIHMWAIEKFLTYDYSRNSQ